MAGANQKILGDTPARPYVDGRHQLGATTIITAGIGSPVVPFRYASPGSVELLDFAL